MTTSIQSRDIASNTGWGLGAGASQLDASEVDENIAQRFAAQVARHADRPAVVTDAWQWTYAQLDRESNRLAGQIPAWDRHDSAAMEAGGASPVAVLMEHEAPLIAAILAALKSGRPYVALDPADLPARRQAVYHASGATVLIADRANQIEGRRLTQSQGQRIDAGEAGAERISEVCCAAAPPDAPAEIAFTSGTTGRPKGVCRSHRALLHHFRNYTQLAQIGPEDRLSLLTPCGLGAAMASLWGALLNGAALMPFDLRVHGAAALPQWARRLNPTLLHCVPSVFRTLAASLRGPGGHEVLESLRILRLGGETVRREDFELFKRHTPPSASLLISYSTTETCMISAMLLGHQSCLRGPLPVGRPVAATEVQVIDDGGHPLPPGEVGRIRVSSRYLSLGYWREPALTAERFHPDPDAPGTCVYDTGDLGRFDDDGFLEHCGRADSQLKIRGRRVDAGEVESALLAQPGVHEAAVIGRDDNAGRPTLVAYLLCSADAFPGEAALRAKLRHSLPEHLVPARFIRLEEFPRTVGGKVNRSTLPWCDPGFCAAPQTCDTPEQAAMESQVAAVWQDALGCGGIGRHDDFFATLGADSLQAADVLACLERTLGSHIPFAALTQHPTVELLAHYLRGRLTAPGRSPLSQVQRGGEGRQPIFFLHGDINGAGIYCHRFARQLGVERPFYSLAPLGFEGWPPPLTIEAMATRYLSDVRAVQPHGPYLLAGFCNAGIVAFEMARQLHSAGEEIGMLGLVRSNIMPTRWPGARNLLEAAADLLGADEDRCLDLFAEIQSRLNRWRRASRRGLCGRAKFVLNLARALPLALRGQPRAGELDPAAPSNAPLRLSPSARVRAVWALHRRARLRYVPGPYHGRILLFWPEQDEAMLHGDRSAGWNRIASQVILHRIPGSHSTCVTQHSDRLAALLRPYL